MASTADFVKIADIFLMRNKEVRWTTGRPVWEHSSTEADGRFRTRAYIVSVSLEEIK